MTLRLPPDFTHPETNHFTIDGDVEDQPKKGHAYALCAARERRGVHESTYTVSI